MTNALVRSIVIASLVVLASCEARPGARLELAVASDDAGVIRQVQAILYNRLREATGGIFGDVRTSYFPELNKLVYEITAGAPRPEALEYLYSTRGEYRVFVAGEDGEVTDWITNQDVADADSGHASRGPTVFVGLSPLAARRVAEVSGDYIGATIQASLDGEFLYATTLTWPIQRFYQFEVASMEEAEMLASVLKYGALPVDVVAWGDNSR
jgi:preprotein translocase subunit SecD